MQKRYLLLVLLSLLLASCFKYIKVDNSIKYTVRGYHDVTVDQNDTCVLYPSVQLLSGDPTNEYISFKLTGVPANVSVNYDSLTFRPNYGFPLVFYAHDPKPGVYPITAIMSSPTVGTKNYSFNLTVTSITDCTPQFSNSQTNSIDGRHEVEMPGTNLYNRYAYVQRAGPDTLQIQVMTDSMEPGSEPDGVQYLVAQFSTVVNCSASSLSIYPQKYTTWLQQANQQVRGNGTYAPVTATTATITINDTVYSGSQINSTNTYIIY